MNDVRFYIQANLKLIIYAYDLGEIVFCLCAIRFKLNDLHILENGYFFWVYFKIYCLTETQPLNDRLIIDFDYSFSRLITYARYPAIHQWCKTHWLPNTGVKPNHRQSQSWYEGEKQSDYQVSQTSSYLIIGHRFRPSDHVF